MASNRSKRPRLGLGLGPPIGPFGTCATFGLKLYWLPHEVVRRPHLHPIRPISVLRGVLHVRIGWLVCSYRTYTTCTLHLWQLHRTYSMYKLQIKSLRQGHNYTLHAEFTQFYSVIFSLSLSTLVHLLELNIIIIVIVMRKRRGVIGTRERSSIQL